MMGWKEMYMAKGGKVEREQAEAPHVECPKCGHRFAHGGEVEADEEFTDPLIELEEEREEPKEESSFMQALRNRRRGKVLP